MAKWDFWVLRSDFLVIFIFIYGHSTYCLPRNLAQCVCIWEHPTGQHSLLLLWFLTNPQVNKHWNDMWHIECQPQMISAPVENVTNFLYDLWHFLQEQMAFQEWHSNCFRGLSNNLLKHIGVMALWRQKRSSEVEIEDFGIPLD